MSEGIQSLISSSTSFQMQFLPVSCKETIKRKKVPNPVHLSISGVVQSFWPFASQRSGSLGSHRKIAVMKL